MFNAAISSFIKRCELKLAANQIKEVQTTEQATTELKKIQKEKDVFNDFSYSGKKEYIEWFEEAKTTATRHKRLQQAIEWIAEGKTRYRKYKGC